MNDGTAEALEAEIRLDAKFARVLRSWPLIIAIGLAGSLAGFIFTTFFPPVYEAEATVRAVVQYGITDELGLVIEDRALARVEDVILSEDTISRVWDRIPEQDRAARGWTSTQDLRQSIWVDRRLAHWGLVGADRDPVFAAQLAELWSEEAMEALETAIEHAWNVAVLMNDAIAEDPGKQAVDIKGATRIIWDCQIVPLGVSPELYDGVIQEEMKLSRGLYPSTYVELTDPAYVPVRRVLWGRGTLILSGTLVGLLVGLWVALAGRDRS